MLSALASGGQRSDAVVRSTVNGAAAALSVPSADLGSGSQGPVSLKRKGGGRPEEGTWGAEEGGREELGVGRGGPSLDSGKAGRGRGAST